jgi:uncharacterized membrane protein YhaH (DUF805 family)
MGKMIGNLFLFSGRIDRLKFFLASFIFLPVVMVGMVLIMPLIAIFVFHADETKKIGFIMAIAVVVAFMWVFFSLQAARFRDIGWNPVMVIPAIIIFDISDLGVAYIFPDLAAPGQHYTYASAVLNFGVTVISLFTPSSDDDSIPSILLPDIRLPRLFSQKWRPAKSNRQPQESMNPGRETVAGARTSFGRLGLD